MTWDLRHGRWQDVLRDVGDVDVCLCDPPYSVKTHNGFRSHDDMVANQQLENDRRRKNGKKIQSSIALAAVPYEPLSGDEIDNFVETFIPRVNNWFIAFGDHITWALWNRALDAFGWYAFAPVVWKRGGGTPRFQGDGPACGVEFICVARPRRVTKCGSLPGVYDFDALKGNDLEKVLVGQKPLDLMRQLVRDYSRPGDTICDPFSGSGTTLLAAVMEGRHAIGAEMDAGRYAIARKRLEAYDAQPQLPGMVAHTRATQATLTLDITGDNK